MTQAYRRGFTIVEILIVVVVVAILASVTAVLYNNVQSQARDTQIRDAADKFSDAVQLFVGKESRLPRGGATSTAPINGSECSDGTDEFVAPGIYACAAGETLIAKGYLPKNFFTSLPQNPKFSTNESNKSIVMYKIPGKNYALIGYVLEDPDQSDRNHFSQELVRCQMPGNPESLPQYDNIGVRNAICIAL